MNHVISGLPYVQMFTSMFLKKLKGLNRYCRNVLVRMVNIAPFEPRSASRNNKRPQTKPNSPGTIEKDVDGRHEVELYEALDAIDAI